MIMSKPEVSSKFDVDDIRKIREYNSLRHIHMAPKEIIAETQAGAEKLIQMLEQRKATKV
jgi:hypothetical protein